MAEITRYNWIKNDKFNSKANISAELNEAVSHFDFSDVDYSTTEETPEFEPYSIPDIVAEFPVQNDRPESIDFRLPDNQLTAENATYIDVYVGEDSDSKTMYLNLDGAKADTATAVNSVTVDWGDDTPKEKFIAAVYTSHKYADTGYYTICVQDGANKADYAKFGFSYIGVASNPPMNKLPIAIRKLSPKVKTFAAKSLCGCPNLSSISIDGGNSLNFPFTGFAVGAFDGYNNVQELSVRGCGAFVSNDAAGMSPFQPLENWKVMRQGSFADNFKYNANRTTSSAFKQLNIGMTHLTAIEDGALSGNQALAGVALYDIASTSNKLRKVGENVFDQDAIAKITMTAANTTIGGLCTLKKTELTGNAKCEIHPNALGSCRSKIVSTASISFTGCKLFDKIDFLPDCVATHAVTTKDVFKGCDVKEVKVPRVDKLTATVNAMSMQGWFQNTTGLTYVDFNEPPAISSLVKFTHTDMFTGATECLTELRYPNYIGEFATRAAQVMWPNNLTCIYYPDSIYSMSTNAASSGTKDGINNLKALRIPFIGQKRDQGYAKGSIAATIFTTAKYTASTNHYRVNTQEISAVAGTSVGVTVSVPNGLTDLSVGFFNTMPFNAFAGLTSLACITFEHAGYITNFPSTRPTKYPSDGSLRYFAGLGSAQSPLSIFLKDLKDPVGEGQTKDLTDALKANAGTDYFQIFAEDQPIYSSSAG